MTAAAETTPSAPATQDLLQSLAVLAGAQWRDFQAAAAHEGLTSMQAKLLGQLVRPLPMRELAALLGCDASNVTGIVDRLEAQGLARREADPHDRRVKRVIATPEGQETVRRVRARMHAIHRALDALDPAERTALYALVEKMRPTLES
ncbi:MarR family winged helix-turn-helix transcriptional regulator [Actinacidiphila acidipaludis]|uniref:MarR family transcriptional regulator n=1 Tax=Actinacidiphila acidipaludis TaxID=2873382 RepID=A0ABS7Q617_9ACTN|nr:MarR family transcriptional regulator [Streptomyces acidipaludis]MBY8878604.1 MarR family transcriptional regulator [Streptomyces acidipaludis]